MKNYFKNIKEVLYTDFTGLKYIVATDDPQFKQKHG